MAVCISDDVFSTKPMTVTFSGASPGMIDKFLNEKGGTGVEVAVGVAVLVAVGVTVDVGAAVCEAVGDVTGDC